VDGDAGGEEGEARVGSSRVHVEEFAEALNWSEAAAQSKLESLGVKLVCDWAGRPSASIRQAAEAFRRIVAEVDGARASQLAQQQEREREESRRTAEEHRLTSNIRVALRRRGYGDPVLYAVTGRALERLRRGEPIDVIERDVMIDVDAR
jgi:hypothetical protein